MTEYGRGNGSEPWHPDDPLFGDRVNWGDGRPGDRHPAEGGHPAPQQGGWDAYPAQQQYHPQQSPQPADDSGWGASPQHGQSYRPGADGYAPDGYGTDFYRPSEGHGADPYGTGGHPVDPYAAGQGDPYGTGGHPAGGYGGGQGDPYGTGGHSVDPYAAGQGDPYGTGGHPAGGYGGGQGDPYGTGGHSVDPYAAGQGDPYGTGGHPAGGYGGGQGDPYGTGGHPVDPYPAGQGDPYGTGGHPAGPRGAGQPAEGPHGAGSAPDHCGGPGRAGQVPPFDQVPRQPGPGSAPGAGRPPQDGGPGPGPDHETGWDPGPDQGESAFFADDEEEDDPADVDGRKGRRDGRSRRGSGTKRRSGCACLAVSLVLAGGLGTVAYFGYDFYQSHFGDAPDYSGKGRGEVQVEIPKGSTLSDMGNILKKAGVVKSHDAFVAAAQQHQKGSGIQAGVYLLRKEMSAAAAVEMMTDPKTMNAVIIAEGLRAADVYVLIDEKLGLDKGSTAKVAKAQADRLGLPEWAGGAGEVQDPLEGFLFPARYDIGSAHKPADVLRKMVARATAEYTKADVVNRAEKLGLDSPLDVITVASLVQQEGKYKRDFEKVSRVVYNRLKPGNTETNGHLEFDSTYNYAKNQSTLDLPPPSTMRQFDHPYNTYQRTGLPPGPIANPGGEALNATLQPARGDWYYFVSITEEKTVFSETYEEHQKNVQRYNAEKAR